MESSRVGPYVIVDRIGRGGMGEVFLARDTRLDRRVALKCLLHDVGDVPGVHDSIVREARVAARISHPHVGAVYDVVDADGRTFIVMEYVEGESLRSVLARGPLPEARVIELGCQLASALVAAHRVGVIHRDLKPANVQITHEGTAKILDFGIAMAYEAATTRSSSDPERPHAPSPEQRAGTPGYMAPEQVGGGLVDERSDIFSLSVVLLEMATGRDPGRSGVLLEMMSGTRRTSPRVSGTGQPLSDGLFTVIATGVAPDPAQRFQTAAEMEAGLRALIVADKGATPTPRWVVAATSTVLVPAVIWALGWLTSNAYNLALERTGAFGVEPPLKYLGWGIRSLLAPLVCTILALAFVWTARFIVTLARAWRPADRWLTSLGNRTRSATDRIHLNDPVVLAQAITAAGLVCLVAFVWVFGSLINAWAVYISRADAAQLVPLSPDNNVQKMLYAVVLTLLFLGSGAGLMRVRRLRRSQPQVRGGAGAMVALGAIALSFLLLHEIPYRIMWSPKEVEVRLDDMRCFAVGEDSTRWLIYCPGAAPPRNRTVAKGSPSLRFLGTVDNIFSSPDGKEGPR